MRKTAKARKNMTSFQCEGAVRSNYNSVSAEEEHVLLFTFTNIYKSVLNKVTSAFFLSLLEKNKRFKCPNLKGTIYKSSLCWGQEKSLSPDTKTASDE